MSDERNNTGHWNTGNRNTGDLNTGEWNTGHRNTGHRNTGHWNTGNRNTGDLNTGNGNTGDLNTGHWNTGNRNTGDFNTGFFCTGTPSPRFFDHPTDLSWEEAYDAIPDIDLPIGAEFVLTEQMTDKEKHEHPDHETIGGFLRKHEKPIQETFPVAWRKMSEEERAKWRSLPNFDKLTPEKSVNLFGIDITDRKQTEGKTATIRLPDGQLVRGELVETEPR